MVRAKGYDKSVERSLTEREIEVVQGLAEGLTNTQIARRLWVAPSTIASHIKRIAEKLDIDPVVTGHRYVRARIVVKSYDLGYIE